MSLRCSLTGHEWGDEQVEVERDERADEIALTEREFRVCERCGERRVIAENTEVRAFDEGDDEEVSTFAPSEEFETEETEDAAIIEGTLETSTPSSDEAEVETDPEGRFDDGENEDEDDEVGVTDDDELKDRVREATGTEVTHDEKSDDTEEDADYVCPDCGFTATGGSFRSGDICPDCGGYIEEA
jgi:rubrerythrin